MKSKKQIKYLRNTIDLMDIELTCHQKIDFPDFANWSRKKRAVFIHMVINGEMTLSSIVSMKSSEQISKCYSCYVMYLTNVKNNLEKSLSMPIL